jgi:hypothetical protein
VDQDTIARSAARLPRRFEPLLLTFCDVPRWLDSRRAVLGSDERTELRVEADSGRVTSVDPESQLPTRFVNSTIEQLVHCIDAYRDYAGTVQRATDESAARGVAEDLRRTLANIDPAALADPEAWWALVAEQARQGLL